MHQTIALSNSNTSIQIFWLTWLYRVILFGIFITETDHQEDGWVSRIAHAKGTLHLREVWFCLHHLLSHQGIMKMVFLPLNALLNLWTKVPKVTCSITQTCELLNTGVAKLVNYCSISTPKSRTQIFTFKIVSENEPPMVCYEHCSTPLVTMVTIKVVFLYCVVATACVTVLRSEECAD